MNCPGPSAHWPLASKPLTQPAASRTAVVPPVYSKRPPRPSQPDNSKTPSTQSPPLHHWMRAQLGELSLAGALSQQLQDMLAKPGETPNVTVKVGGWA